MKLSEIHNSEQSEVFRWAPGGNEVFKSNLEHIPNMLFHITPASRVESILKSGLLMGSERSSQAGSIKGIYLIADPNYLADDAMDNFANGVVLEVDVSSFKSKLKPDPEWRSSDNDNPMHAEEDIAWYADFNIDPKFIKVRK